MFNIFTAFLILIIAALSYKIFGMSGWMYLYLGLAAMNVVIGIMEASK